LKRIDYFDGLLGSAKDLVSAADAAVNLTKNFRQGLQHAHKVLVTDFTEDEIDENMGDIDFANDFTEELLKVESELKTLSLDTEHGCYDIKHKLEAALTGIESIMVDEEEELVELSEHSRDELAHRFNKISDECSNYFNQVGSDIDHTQNTYIAAVINQIQSVKKILLLRNKQAYSDLKIQLFNVLDAARDVGLKIESSQHRVASNVTKINKFISKKGLWYYQEKYTKNTTKSCRIDRAIVEEFQGKLEAEFEKFVSMTQQLGSDVNDDIKRDIAQLG